jgi:hypothetical protein
MAGAVVNTNLATAVGVLVWIGLDAWLSKEKKPTFLGGVNGMICGLVGITPCAGWVNGWGAIMWVPSCTIDRVDRLELPLQGAAVLQGGRRPGCHLHPRHRRLLRRLVPGPSGDPNMIEYGCGHLNSAGQVVNTSARPTSRRRAASVRPSVWTA